MRVGGTGRALALCAAALTWSACAGAAAGLDGVYTDAKSIQMVLTSIPMRDKSMGYQNLAQRLPKLALTVERLSVGRFTDDDISTSAGALRKGDVDYQFSLSPPNPAVMAMCPLARRFGLIRRGMEWLPQDRTANFLVSGQTVCAAP